MRDFRRGAVVVGRTQWARTPLVQSLVAELKAANLSTLEVVLDGGRVPELTSRVSAAAAEARAHFGDDLPIAFLGAGRAAAIGWRAAYLGEVDGVMAWNPRARVAWHRLPDVDVPSLLFVDERARCVAVANRVARRLGGAADVVRAEFDAHLLGGWFEYRLRGGEPLAALRRPLPPMRRRVTAVAAGVAAGVMTLPVAASGSGLLPDFSAGARLAAADIGGDSAPSGSSTPTDRENNVKDTEIKGDGPIGDPPLTDGIGVRWNINTNVGFSTSSSASGAVSEAGWVPGNPTAATTLNGGIVNQTLGDGLDGYQGLCLDVNNVGGQCNTANMVVYNQNGPGSLECSGRQVVLPPQTIGNFTVARKVFVPTTDGFIRWIDIITNNALTTQTARVQKSNNLGSDAGTTVVTTSDGDTTPELTDTYVTTFQNFSGTTSPDPRLGHVLRGVNAPVGLAAINFVNGDDNPFWRYVFNVPAGQTAIIMNFATARGTRSAAATTSASLANLTNPDALNCLTAAEQGQVVNFDLSAPTDIALADSSIDEDAASGSAVGTFSTTDPTPADTHTYELVAGTGSTDNASFTIVGNELRTATALDFETQDEYSIRVRTTDLYGQTFEEVFTITVNDVVEDVAPTAIVFAVEDCSIDGDTGTMIIEVADSDTALGSLVVTAESSDPTLVTPTVSADLGGGQYRLTLATNPANSGDATVTVTVDDGTTTATTTVNVRVGTSGADVLTGTSGTDAIFGRGDADELRGSAEKDLLCGGEGNDLMYGGSGNDALFGNDGVDNLNGGLHFDRLYGESGNDVLKGDAGGDDLHGGPGSDRLVGGKDNDNLYGEDDPDRLNGGPGADAYYGGGGTDKTIGFNAGEGDTADSETP